MPVSMVTGVGGFMLDDEDEFSSSLKKAEPPLSLWMSLSWGTVSHLPASIQGISKHFNIDRRGLTILSTVIRGEFGSIVNGQMAVDDSEREEGHRGVMMKLLTGFQKQYGHRDEITKFLERATLLHGLEHPNLQCVLRVSVEDNLIPIVVYPIVEYGNMHNFLTFCRVAPSESPLNPVTQHHKLNFALQIAKAMNHLSDHGIIHPDLALRNCFLDTNYTVKVADGALSQENYPECYYTVYGTVRPVRWAAIETLQEGLCTTQSNVWSYGVTVWEVLTLAELPYSDVDNNRSILSQLMMDSRLPQPEGCSDNLYSLLMSCWKKKAEERPNFATLLPQIKRMTEGPRPPAVTTKFVRIPSVDVEQFDRESNQPFATNLNDPEFRRQSTGNRLSPHINQRPLNRYSSEQLSLTFSVLSCDTVGEGESEHSSSDGENEAVPPLMMAPLLSPDMLERGDQVAPINAHQGSNNLMSTFHSADELELQTSSSHLTGHASPSSPSTVQTWLTPFESTSYSSRRETLRSDDASYPPLSSPSPDLTSKTSTIGDETLSTVSISNMTQTNADDCVSKTSSTLESVSVSTLATPTLSGVGARPVHSSGSSSAVPEQQHNGSMVNGHTATRSPLLVDHSKTNGSVPHYPPPPSTTAMDTRDTHARNGNSYHDNDPHQSSNRHERSMSNGGVGSREGERLTTEGRDLEPLPSLADKSDGPNDSGGLGIDFSDLSSAFESWNLSS